MNSFYIDFRIDLSTPFTYFIILQQFYTFYINDILFYLNILNKKE